MSVNDCAVGIFCITEHFVTKLGMFMKHHEPECHAEKLVHCLQCQGHSKDTKIQRQLFASDMKMCTQICFGDVLIIEH